MCRRGHDRQVVGEDVARAEHHAGQRHRGEQQVVHRPGRRGPPLRQQPRRDEAEEDGDGRGDDAVDHGPLERAEQPGLLEQRRVVGPGERERAAVVAEQRPGHRAEPGDAQDDQEEQAEPGPGAARPQAATAAAAPPACVRPDKIAYDRPRSARACRNSGIDTASDKQPGHAGGERERRREVADRRVQGVGRQREVRVVGQRRGDAEVRDRLGEPDRERGHQGGGEDRHDQPQRLPPGRAVHPGGVLELLPKSVQSGAYRQIGERHAAQPEQQHDAERPHDQVGDPRPVKPDPVHDPVLLDEPLPAESPAARTAAAAPATCRRRPSGARASWSARRARRRGSPRPARSPAAADDTHSELTTATAVDPVSDCRR